jgi:integrase
MGPRRTKHPGLPKHVRPKNGAYHYEDPVTRKWTRLAPLDDYAGMLTALARILAANAETNTIEKLWAKYQIEVLPTLAQKTQKNRRIEMKRPLKVFGKMDPADIEPHHGFTYFKKRGETEQARKEVRAVSALLTYARQVGARKTENPFFALGLEVDKKDRPYVTDAMFYAVRDIAPPMLGYAMDLAWCAGLDGGTIRSLERRHITETGLLFPRVKTRNQKPGKLQQIDGPDLVEILKAALRLPPQVRRFVICARGGRPYTADGFQSAWQDAIAKAIRLGRLDKSQRYGMHDLRGKAGSESESDEAAKNLLGHGDVKVTQRYRRLPVRGEALKILGRERK